jgi:hypothetical protein
MKGGQRGGFTNHGGSHTPSVTLPVFVLEPQEVLPWTLRRQQLHAPAVVARPMGPGFYQGEVIPSKERQHTGLLPQTPPRVLA